MSAVKKGLLFGRSDAVWHPPPVVTRLRTRSCCCISDWLLFSFIIIFPACLSLGIFPTEGSNLCTRGTLFTVSLCTDNVSSPSPATFSICNQSWCAARPVTRRTQEPGFALWGKHGGNSFIRAGLIRSHSQFPPLSLHTSFCPCRCFSVAARSLAPKQIYCQ